MKKIHPFVLLILGIWLLATIACFATKNPEPIYCAMWVTLLAGMAYCHSHY